MLKMVCAETRLPSVIESTLRKARGADSGLHLRGACSFHQQSEVNSALSLWLACVITAMAMFFKKCKDRSPYLAGDNLWSLGLIFCGGGGAAFLPRSTSDSELPRAPLGQACSEDRYEMAVALLWLRGAGAKSESRSQRRPAATFLRVQPYAGSVPLGWLRNGHRQSSGAHRPGSE